MLNKKKNFKVQKALSFRSCQSHKRVSHMTQQVKNHLPMQETGDAGSIPGSRRSPGGENGNPL